MAIYRSDDAGLFAREETTPGTVAISNGNGRWIGGLVASAEITPPIVEWKTYPIVSPDRHYGVVFEGKHKLSEIRIPIILQDAVVLQYLFDGKRTAVDTPSNGFYTHM